MQWSLDTLSEMTQTAELLTLDQFERLPEDDAWRLELTRGRLVGEPRPGARHSWIVGTIYRALDAHARKHALGKVFVEAGFLLSVDPPTVRGPDVAFLSDEKMGSAAVPIGFWRLAPDLAVEVLSPSNSAIEIQAKVLDYLAAGTRRVWVVDPHNQTVVVHDARHESRTLSTAEILAGDDVLPRFRIPLTDLFGAE